MAQNTNLNTSPYFDDFDGSKNYKRVLFKPGTPIQARELTTLQSILQDQIEKFGKNTFKEGSVVIPGSIAYDPEYTCVQVDPTHLGVDVTTYLESFVGKLIKGAESGVTAKVERYLSATDSENENNTLYIKYQSSGEENFSISTFIDGEDLVSVGTVNYGVSSIRQDSTFATCIISDSVATGSAAKIENGVYFLRGFFVEVFSQTILLDQYSNFPSYRIGLTVEEEVVVASQQNRDLYDNARGFSNFAAPGADRLKITATLSKKTLEDFNDENFIELMRIENGVLSKFTKKVELDKLITDVLARRTYDESGDYYVTPFKVSAKESLINGIGNDGVYNFNTLTKQGNIPSEDLLTLQISPGKAYVKGYEVETINTINIDLEKPRTTKNVKNSSVTINAGNQLELNNVYGSTTIGFGNTSQVKLFSNRTSTPGSSSGIEVGVARVLDLKLKNAAYEDASTVFETVLYDIQTFTYLNLNTTVTLTSPAYITGDNSGATGFLYEDVTNSNQLVLYQVSGKFIQNENLKSNGVTLSRTVTSVKDYSINDVRQLTSLDETTFTADTLLEQPIYLAPQTSSFTISAASAGVSTITTSNKNFGVGISTGDIISYTKTGEIVPTFNRVKSVTQTLKSVVIEATTSVTNVCSGTLPTSSVTSNEVFKVVPEVKNSKEAYLFEELEHSDISSVDLSSASLVYRRSYPVTISNNSVTATLESDTTITAEPFDEEDYTLIYDDGTIEPLTSDQFTVSGGRTVILVDLSKASGSATLIATLRKQELKSRKKIHRRCEVLILDKSNKASSGIGTTTLNDGLTFSSIYGTRVQDEQISLGVPDVTDLLGVFESSDENEPDFAKLQIINLNANILNSIKGEIIYGETSNARALLISNNGSNQVDMVYVNENTFIQEEKVTFLESGITANVSLVIEGDRDITDDFIFNSGQELDIVNYSYLKRKDGRTAPTRKIKIIYNSYYIDPSDDGQITVADSYGINQFSGRTVEVAPGLNTTDIVDLRPRVDPYDFATATKSPFEYNARTFDPGTNSSSLILAKDKPLVISYNYYVPRIDKLYLTKTGEFVISKGIPDDFPTLPDPVDGALEVATIYLPAYVYFTEDVQVRLAIHKRYRMQDIARIEDRLKNVEYYTSLSLLESETKNLSLKDAQTGLDRFKTGFLVDNFKSSLSGFLGHPAHKCSIDTVEGVVRPQHYTTSIDLLLGSEAVVGNSNTSDPTADYRFVKDLGTPNTVKVGDVVCLKYKDKEWLKNKFATRVENVNPFHVVNWIGQIELNPATDTWIETKKTKKIEDIEGNYNSTVQQLGVDTNTGLTPIDWGSWETTWTGTKETNRVNMGSIFQGSTLVSSSTRRGRFRHGRGVPITTTKTYRDQYINFQNVTTLTTTKQSRKGIQYKVGEKFDTTNLGDRVVSTDVIHTMRSRNIEFIARRLKPKTRLYTFFDNIDVNKYTLPKLIEIQMKSGTFQLGEEVSGKLGNVSIKFRLAKQNHKYGPYNKPTQVFVENPYNVNENLPGSYSSTSTVLNVDTASLELQAASGFFGYVVKNMKLKGKTSGAVAQVSNLRLITDASGTLIGSLFIPDPTLPSTPSFETGTKTFTLTTSKTNVTISGSTDSSGEAKFVSSGTLNNVEEVTLRIRNATIERNIKTDEQVLKSSKTETKASTTFSNRSTTQTRWVDPLAQSFEVPDDPGVFITKVDVFFKTKDTKNLPVTAQIRTMQTGLPTQEILPFGEVILDPSEVILSEDGSKATSFVFPSPVYCEGGTSYCVVLLSASNEYTCFISRMGEEDVTTVNKIEAEKIIVSQQPLLGSLFKSQNGATWDPSQLEDLKLTIYRAEFFEGTSTVRFYNPALDIGNKQIATLQPNPLDVISRSMLIGIGKSLSASEQTNLTPGVTVLQNNNGNFSGKLVSVVGAIGIGSTLAVSAVGSGFTSGFKTYSNVDLVSLTGNGTGAKVNLSVNGGVAVAATVSIGGTGYTFGDALTVDYTQTDSRGTSLVLSIPNITGIISAFNGLVVENVQGNPVQNATDDLFYVGTSGTSNLSSAKVKYINIIDDGLHFRVSHRNHGMYSTNDFVTLSGMEPDVKPVTLESSLSPSSTEPIVVSSVGILTSFENLPVSSLNPGYVLIDDEVIKYTGVVTSTSSITGIQRSVGGTIAGQYDSKTKVYKYELSGISLTRINKTHSLADSNQDVYPNDLDYYYLQVDQEGEPGVASTDRSSSNANGFPELYFRQTKSCGSYEVVPLVSSESGQKATQNIPFNTVHPKLQIMSPAGTFATARIRTVSGSTPDSSLLSFVDQGFESVSLNETNYLSSPRIIASKINETKWLSELPASKSFTLEVDLTSENDLVSPMIDLDRVNLITIGNRLNSKISNYKTDSRVNSLFGDPTAATYLSKIVNLEKPADSIKVLFDAYRHSTSDIRVLYRLFRVDSKSEPLWELFPGHKNLDVNKNIKNINDNDGTSDTFVGASTTEDDFRSYEYNIKNLPQFSGFQIKVLMTGSNSSFVPKIRDFRAISSI